MVEVTDGQVVRAGVSVMHDLEAMLEPRSGQTWGVQYFCSMSYLIKK